MNTATMAEFTETDLEQEIPEFKIAIMFENLELGTSAMVLCQRLMNKFSDNFNFRLTMESFAALENAATFDEAVTDAAKADMILVAGTGSLPSVLHCWCEQFVAARKAHSPGIVVDMAPSSASAGALHEYLKEIAGTHHLDVISREECTAALQTTTSSSSCRARRRGTPAWGINE